MANREKVIKGLALCLTGGDASSCKDCPYDDECKEAVGISPSPLKRDALELLKWQEPVEPIRLENWWKCPSCGGNIVANMKYCSICGRRVNWDAVDRNQYWRNY